MNILMRRVGQNIQVITEIIKFDLNVKNKEKKMKKITQN
jgi:hypothetical protein